MRKVKMLLSFAKRVICSKLGCESHLIHYNKALLDRSLYLVDKIKKVENVEGSIVECGVGMGYSLSIFGGYSKREIFCFDSFEGFPKFSVYDGKIMNRNKLKVYEGFTIKYVKKRLRNFEIPDNRIDGIHYMKGFIPDSLKKFKFVKNKSIAILHLDLDIYQPYKDSFEFFYPYVKRGA